MRLFIAEKPELGKAIAAGLGGGQTKKGHIVCGEDVVTWCFGHLLQLCDPEDYDLKYKKWNFNDLPMIQRPWKLKPIHDKKDQLKLIKKLLKETDEVVNAGDPDPEGQLLVDEVIHYFECKKPVKRVLINDLNTKVVKKALNNLQDNKDFEGLYHSALARSVADQEYGYNLTRSYTLAGRARGISNVLSIGRVQTPILGLVVNRDKQHEGHNESFYYVVKGEFECGQALTATYLPAEDAPIGEKKRLIDAEFANRVAGQCKGKSAVVKSSETENKTTPPPLPYNLLKLQADANKKFGLKPDAVLKITQKLREKYKLITYNRSDCQYLSDEHHEDAETVLNAIAETAPQLKEQTHGADISIKGRAFNSEKVSAHHGIIPTEATANIGELTKEEQSIYLLIARQYVAQFYPHQKYRATKVIIECEGHPFKITSKVTTDPGWQQLFKKDLAEQESEGEQADTDSDLSSVQQGTIGKCVDCVVKQEKTKPPKRYTMATLLMDLAKVSKYVKDPKIKKLLMDKDKDKEGESGGIGTPATRSAIIKTLFDRGFLEENGKSVVSTKLGRNFCAILPEQATTPDMTALWHEQQVEVEKGEKTHLEFLDEIATFITASVNEVKEHGLQIKGAAPAITCPTCKKGSLIRYPSKKAKGKFWWGCSDYQQGCKATFFDQDGKPKLEESKRYKCPNCEGGALYQLEGKRGPFWGCTKYKEGCQTTYPDKDNKPDITKKPTPAVSTEYKCPSCDHGLVKYPSKKKEGAFWWGCSNFKNGCKETFFDQEGKPNFETAN